MTGTENWKSFWRQYEEIRPLSKRRENIRILAFPIREKYWKLANHYYTHNKAGFRKKWKKIKRKSRHNTTNGEIFQKKQECKCDKCPCVFEFLFHDSV